MMSERLMPFLGIVALIGWLWLMVSWAEDDLRLRIFRRNGGTS